MTGSSSPVTLHRDRRRDALRGASGSVKNALALVAIAVVLIWAAGCSTSKDTVSASLEPTEASQAPWSMSPEAQAIAAVLNAQQAWTYEPRGDVPAGALDVGGTLVFAIVHRVEADSATPTITFDAAQLYVGGDLAEPAAREDGRSIQGGSYVRNAYKHRQTVKIAPGCPVVYAVARTSMSGRFPHIPEDIPLRRHGYWLVIDRGKVTAMIWMNLNS